MSKTVTVSLPTLDEGFHFRARRVQMGLSQRELAQRADVSECTLRRLERGEVIGLPFLQRLAPHLNLTFGQAIALMVPLEASDEEAAALARRITANDELRRGR
jgi:transcriptional regulator with XRE-family HTH domain